MALLSITILLLYLITIGSLIYGFDKVSISHLDDTTVQTKFSVIIPFRNEAEHLPVLLESISALNYPESHFEIIFVDDTSEDNSVEIIKRIFQNTMFNYRIIKNIKQSSAPKKDAITSAINTAAFDWIITTDADCHLPKYWLDAFDNYIQHNKAQCIAGPVTYENTDSFLKRFQLLDFLSLQGATIGGFGIRKPFLCNGANFCYKKQLFQQLNGFEGNSHISSGDDIFLLQKVVQRNKNQVHYLKNKHAIVTTHPQQSFKDLVSQRVRWAAKTSSYNSLFGKLIALIVFLMNGYLVCTPLLVLAGFVSAKFLMYLFVVKFCIDFLLLFKTARFYNQEHYLPSYIISSILYPIFSVFIMFVSIFKGFKWKGRSYSK